MPEEISIDLGAKITEYEENSGTLMMAPRYVAELTKIVKNYTQNSENFVGLRYYKVKFKSVGREGKKGNSEGPRRGLPNV